MAFNKCEQCGHRNSSTPVVKTFYPGDIVENSQIGLGIIPSEGLRKYLRGWHDLPGHVTFIGFNTGAAYAKPASELRVIHGHIHIDRE